MRIHDTSLDPVKLIELDFREDERGYFARLYCADELADAGIDHPVVQRNVSMSREAGTMRGIHYQRDEYAESKFITCIRGRIFDVAVDMRPESPTYLQWAGFELDETSLRSVFVPAGFAHGYLTLTDGAIASYSVSTPYHPAAEARRGGRGRLSFPRPPNGGIDDRAG